MILSFCQISLLLRYVHYISNPITLLLGSQRIRNNSKKMLTASIRNFYSENHPSSPCYKLNSLQKNNRRCSQIELIMSNDNIRKNFITSSGQNSVVIWWMSGISPSVISGNKIQSRKTDFGNVAQRHSWK